MSHTHTSESGDAHTHEHSDNCEEALSAKYAEYVEAHLEQLRAKCNKINICIDELLEDENILVIVNGYDLSIKKTCSLVYKVGSETVTNSSKQCTPKDKVDIRNDVENHLKYEIENEKPVWKNVTKCLDRNYENSERSTFVDEICGLAYNRTQICNAGTHRTIRDFFNDQIHHLKCTCKALQTNHFHWTWITCISAPVSSHRSHKENLTTVHELRSTDKTSQTSMPIVVGSIAGGFLLLLVLFAIGFICYRKRKSRKREKQTPNVIYVQAPGADNFPVYQEIFDDKTHGNKQSPSLNPPTLPKRYTTMSGNTSNGSKLTSSEDEQGYLEPVAASSRLRPTLPLPGQANPGYGAPPEYSLNDGMNRENTEGSYFEPIPSPADDEDKGYDTLGRNKTGVDASRPEMVPLGPVPAKRTKKDDRQTESHYFELETDSNNRAEYSPV